MRRDKLVSSTVYNTAVIMWAMLQIHEVMAEFSKHNIKRHPSITSIFFRFLVTSNIPDPLQENSQMKIDSKVLSTKSYRHHGRLAYLEDSGKS